MLTSDDPRTRDHLVDPFTTRLLGVFSDMQRLKDALEWYAYRNEKDAARAERVLEETKPSFGWILAESTKRTL